MYTERVDVCIHSHQIRQLQYIQYIHATLLGKEWLPIVAAAVALATVASAATLPVPPSNNDGLVSSQILQDPYSYIFPKLGTQGSKLFPMQDCNGIQLEEITIDQLQTFLKQRKFTTIQLAMCYMKRIYQLQPYTNAILEFNPDWIDIANKLDQERDAGRVRGPLHGIPFIVKDNIGTKDKMQTTAGSWALLGSVLPRDSFVVHQLREAGALLLGKAGLSEWADMRSNSYSEGYSARGGQVRSAYNFSVNPGGSSTGSGVAVSTNQVMFALGTETDGSIVNPASRNSIVGIKPTVGLTSRSGVIPESLHQDTVGVHARTVRDATYVLDAIHGVDARDNQTSTQVGKTPAGGYSQFLSTQQALKGAKFGIPWESFWSLAPETQQQQLGALIDLMRQAGATIYNGTEILTRKLVISPTGWNWDYGTARGFPNESEYTYIKVDFYNNIKTYLSELENTKMHSLEDIVQFNYDNDGSEGGHPNVNPAFQSGQDGFLASLATKGVQDQTYWQALHFCQKATREDGIDAALNFKDIQLDALLVPTEVAQAPQVAAQAGYPMVTIPGGVTAESGMPFGLGFMGTAYSESTLIKYASAVEDLQKNTTTPYQRELPAWRGYLDRVVPVAF